MTIFTIRWQIFPAYTRLVLNCLLFITTTGNRKQPQETKSKTEAKESPQKETKSEQEIPLPVPVVEISSEAAVVASTVDGVESTPEVGSSTGSDKLPEIKVVQPSPELKTKTKPGEGENEEVETPNERTEEKVDETGGEETNT